MHNTKKCAAVCAIVVIGCVAMAIVDAVMQPDYWIKSAVKLVLFLALPLLYSAFDKSLDIKSLFRINTDGVKITVFLCVPLFVIILGAYFIFKDVFDFSGITKSLTGNIGVNKENFVFVAVYISFINSLLEEFFFRGFAFLALRKAASRRFAYIFSAAAFAAYHIAIMTGWFSAAVFAIALVGLFVGGMIFNRLNDKSGNIYTSWFVHMSANFAINTIGFMLFEII